MLSEGIFTNDKDVISASLFFHYMSFLSLFKQPKKLVKPFKCRSCKCRSLIKAHAANHQRQSSSLLCRKLGFVFDLEKKIRQEGHSEKSVIELLKQSKKPSPVVTDGSKKSEVEDEDVKGGYSEGEVALGADDENLKDEIRSEMMRRKGCMRATPSKISQVLGRMEEKEIIKENPRMSQRMVARKVAAEYSTVPRNPYRWK